MFNGLENQRKEPYIRLRNLNVVHFLNPKADEIKIDDIAWHLARTCRFNAALNQWYSNAEHSVLGSWKASNTAVTRAFLIHDAAEYVFGDIASPVGSVCPEYKAKCETFQNWLYIHFLGKMPTYEVLKEVKEIDTRICASEMKYIRRQSDEDLCVEPYDDIQFYYWDWKLAYNRYTTCFRYHFPEYKGE